MQYMYKVMEDQDIPKDSHIAIEYRIPNSNKRVDLCKRRGWTGKRKCSCD